MLTEIVEGKPSAGGSGVRVLTDAEKIRRLPFLMAASSTNSTFCVLTFMGAVFILFLNELGFDKTRIGLLLGLIPFSQIAALFVAPLLARVGLKRSFLIFFGLRKVIFSLMLAAPLILERYGVDAAFRWVAVVLGVFSLSRAAAETAVWSWTQEIVPNKIRGKFSAVNTLIATAAVLVTVATAGYVIGHFPGLGRFMVLMGVGLAFGVVSVVLYGFVPGGSAVRQENGLLGAFKTMYATLGDRNYVYFILGLGLATLGLTSLFSFVPLFMREKVGLGAGEVVWLDVAQYSGAILSCFLWGWTSDRYGSKPVMLVSLGVSLSLPVLWFLMPRHGEWSRMAAMGVAVLAGVANIGWTVGFSRYLFVTAVPPERKTPYMAVFYAWFGLLAGAGPLLAGWFLDYCGGLDKRVFTFTIDQFTPFFGTVWVVLLVSLLVLTRIHRDGALATPTFVGMFLHGNPLMAFTSLLRYRWARGESDRVLTTERLGHARTLLSANELIEALSDPSFNVRYEAIIAIAHLPSHPQLVDALLVVLDGDQPELSVAAAWALGKLGDPSAILPMREMLLSDYPLLRARSARALALLGDQDSRALFRERLLSEPDVSLRIAYATGLGALRDQESLADILALLRQTSEPTSREELAFAVARIVSTEPHYIRLRRRLLDDSATSASQIVRHYRRALTFVEGGRMGRLRVRAERCSDMFARGDMEEGLVALRGFVGHLPLERLPMPLRVLLDESLARTAEYGAERFEYVVLLFYVVGRALRHLHTGKPV